MTAKLIDGKQLAAEIDVELTKDVQEIKSRYNVTPTLAVVLVGDNPASKVYVRRKQEAAARVGMDARDVHLPADTSQAELLRHVAELSEDDTVHGILVQLPLPDHLDKYAAIEAIAPLKDVDGLHPFNVGLLSQGRHRFLPATPGGIQTMLMRSGYDPAGKHVVVCGRSEIVGKPMATMLIQKQTGANATVTLCHSRTKDLAYHTRQADILIVAIDQPLFVKADMVKEGAVVIDVGMSEIAAPERKRGYRLVGDVDFDSVVNVASAITPVPGGVGPMTIATLLQNTVTAARLAVGA